MTTETKHALTNLHPQTNTDFSVTSKLMDVKIEIKHTQKERMPEPLNGVKFRYPTNGLYGLL